MIDFLRKSVDWLTGVKSAKEAATEPGSSFKLVLDGLKVGELLFDGEKWVFRYSEQFRDQNEVKPIIDFPSLEKEYRSERLWPFFLLRIPSPEQPSVKRFAEEQGTLELDEALLLKRFGRRSVANPFELVSA